MPDLTGKISFVTAGATGIGLGCARAIVEAGGKVMICARRKDTLEAAAEELGDAAAWVQCDVTDDASVDAAVAATVDGAQTVSYDHIESTEVYGIGAAGLDVTVMGTNGNDNITAIGLSDTDPGPNAVLVSVNDGPMTEYTYVATLTLLGKNGDDDIDIDLAVADFGLPLADNDR